MRRGKRHGNLERLAFFFLNEVTSPGPSLQVLLPDYYDNRPTPDRLGCAWLYSFSALSCRETCNVHAAHTSIRNLQHSAIMGLGILESRTLDNVPGELSCTRAGRPPASPRGFFSTLCPHCPPVIPSLTTVKTPGTTRYFDDPNRPQAANDSHHGLKVDASGDVPIILVSSRRDSFCDIVCEPRADNKPPRFLNHPMTPTIP